MINKDSTLYDVVGIGNAIVDVLAKVGDGFLRERSLPKGGMTLVEAADAGKIYADLIPEREVSGGSAANTVSGLASLGSDCAFIGKVHDDELGQEFQRNIGAAGIDFFTKPLTEGPSTGRSIVLVTPDAERSMFKACELAHKHNRKVAFSLSDKSCLLRNKDEIVNLIKDHVDILFGNEEELKTLFAEDDFYKALDLVKPLVEIAAVTRNAKGSVVVNGRVKIFVEAEKVDDVVDSTGAGDLYAAGFLYGITQERSLGTCAMIGGICAAEIISHYGARPEVSLRGFVRNRLRQYGKRA